MNEWIYKFDSLPLLGMTESPVQQLRTNDDYMHWWLIALLVFEKKGYKISFRVRSRNSYYSDNSKGLNLL